MDMRVVVEAACVRVQHGDGSGRALQLPVVPAEAVHRFPGAAHQEVEDDIGAGRRESAQMGGQGKGQQKIVGRDQTLHLAFQPLLALVVVTIRAKAMAAGMRHQLLMRTFAAEWCSRHCPIWLGSA